MAEIYTTTQGDTWDMIAKKMCDDETMVGLLMEYNLDVLDIFVFDSGTDIFIPDLEEEEEDDLPEWRYDEEDDEDGSD